MRPGVIQFFLQISRSVLSNFLYSGVGALKLFPQQRVLQFSSIPLNVLLNLRLHRHFLGSSQTTLG